MSLAATTSTALTLIDAPSLKINAPTTETQYISLPASPIASVWTPDNATLYIASSHAIHAYSPASGALTQVFTTPADAPLAALLLARDTSTLIIVQATTTRVLSLSTSPAKITFSLPAHAQPVASIALSNDGTLLASASTAGVLHVYNLAHNANTVLRSISRARCVVSFDPHVRTRLLVTTGVVLALYDTSRAGGAVKTVTLAEKGTEVGQVVAISSSPFSKSLVTVACSSLVNLIDLDRDRPLFKNIPVKAPVTSMTFSADGGSVLIGTEGGKVLVNDLRTMERGPRMIDAGKGEKVVALSMQKRMKSSLTVPRIPTSQSAPLSTADVNVVKSPARRTVSSRTPATPTPKPKPTAKSDASKPKPDAPAKRTFSPPRAPAPAREDEGDISVQLETLIGGGGKKASRTQPAGTGTAAAAAAMRPSSRLAGTGARSVSGKGSVAQSDTSAGTRASVRDAAPTPTSSHPSPSSLARSQPSKPQGSSSKLTLPRSNASPLSRRTSAASTLRTATPDLPSPSVDAQDSPLWTRGYALKPPNVNSGGLLTTPDLDRWIEAGRGASTKEGVGEKEKEKRVGWADEDTGDESDKENAGGSEPTILSKSMRKDKENAVPDMSPMRRPHLPAGAIQLSPLRGNAPGGNGGAQELLRAVVKDVMYEYRQETREEIKGLHLDLLKVGRSWKTELRTMMQEYVGDLRDLREENLRLRGENDRLRRGY